MLLMDRYSLGRAEFWCNEMGEKERSVLANFLQNRRIRSGC